MSSSSGENVFDHANYSIWGIVQSISFYCYQDFGLMSKENYETYTAQNKIHLM